MLLCFIVLLIFVTVTCTVSANIGTTLFYNKLGTDECWSQDDLAKLRARKIFQSMMPPQVSPSKINSRYIKDALRYYRGSLRNVGLNLDHHTSVMLKEALVDTIGGHLRSEMLPSVRFAYYAGYVPYKHARELHDFYENTKTLLNTNGMGWRQPANVPRWANLTVNKILIGSGKLLDPCDCLITKRDSSACIHLPSPKLDDDTEPTAIALPFRVGGFVSLNSPRSENILLKYYTSAARCILQKSSRKCRHSDFVNFNNDLWHWMKRNVAPHLLDEKLYVAYGGVFRIAAAVQSYGKGLSRRNLFEYQDAGVPKWQPWKALTRSHINVDTDWTPTLYVVMVLLAALGICLLQICYNRIFGDGNGCHCGRHQKESQTSDVAYATVDTTFPSLLPAHRSSETRKHSDSKTRSSIGSVKTQKVYDFNENTEKVMEVIMSDREESDTESSQPEESEEADHVINLGQSKKRESPPELHTPIAQLRIDKKPRTGKSLQEFTTTTTQSDATYCQEQRASESMWSGSGSSSSDASVSTISSQTPTRKTRTSRNLAWARRVVSKHTLHTLSTTGTEFDINSFTTPPSRR